MPRRSRAQWVREAKGELANHMTSGELAAYLGLNHRYLRKLVKDGKIPDAVARAENGWKLWSPEQVTKILRSRIGA